MIDARFVNNTGRRAETRRSTSGSRRRSWYQPHARKITTDEPAKPSVAGLVQPQTAPLTTGRSRQINPAASPIVPR